LRAGLCRIMQDYCGEFKSETTLDLGLWWIQSIRESEGSTAFARNPHELCRVLENQIHMTVAEIIMHMSLARKASSLLLDFKRLDFPAVDPPEWNKIVTIRQESQNVRIGELPIHYWLQPPYSSSCEENYAKHGALQGMPGKGGR
jgi:succinate dehydrogenase/fumarate reductase flavoprotein subunit